MGTQCPIEPLGAALLQHPLPIGRVADDDALLCRQSAPGGVGLLKADEISDAGLFGVGIGNVQTGGVDVRAEDLILAMVFQRQGFLPGVLPDGRIHAAPFF